MIQSVEVTASTWPIHVWWVIIRVWIAIRLNGTCQSVKHEYNKKERGKEKSNQKMTHKQGWEGWNLKNQEQDNYSDIRSKPCNGLIYVMYILIKSAQSRYAWQQTCRMQEGSITKSERKHKNMKHCMMYQDFIKWNWQVHTVSWQVTDLLLAAAWIEM